MNIRSGNLVDRRCILFDIECRQFIHYRRAIDMMDNKINGLPQTLVVTQSRLKNDIDFFLLFNSVYQVKRWRPGEVSYRIEFHAIGVASFQKIVGTGGIFAE